MCAAMSSPRLVVLLLAAALVMVGCGREVRSDDPSQPALLAPPGKTKEHLGFPEAATKNTTRIPATDPVELAATVARAVYPDPARKPSAVTLVDTSDWRVAIAAAALMAPPFKAPILFSDGTTLPGPSKSALGQLAPPGAKAAGNAQIIRVGNVARPAGYKTTDLQGTDGLELTRSIARLLRSAHPRVASRIIVASTEDASFAMPAASYAAKTGDPILFVNKDEIPPETREALATLKGLAKPRIYILGPSRLISPAVSKQLKRFGSVHRLGARDAITNAIEFARYRGGEFGWGVSTPGHGMVFMRTGRPLYAAAAAPLSASGSYGPLLLLDDATRLPPVLESQLLDTQPAYRTDPVAGVYNHGWIIGPPDAISVPAQARIDALLEIAPEHLPGNLDGASTDESG
jgi:putative cell wall binding repeat protein